jgi:hypothetical protein
VHTKKYINITEFYMQDFGGKARRKDVTRKTLDIDGRVISQEVQGGNNRTFSA